MEEVREQFEEIKRDEILLVPKLTKLEDEASPVFLTKSQVKSYQEEEDLDETLKVDPRSNENFIDN